MSEPRPTEEEMRAMRALHAAILELEPIEFLLMLSPCIARLVRDYGPEPAKEMFLTTIDKVVALKRDAPF